MVDEVRHDGLVLRAIPRNVSRLSGSISIARLVVLMEDGSLSGPPLAVGVWNWRVSGKHPADVPPEEVWVVEQSSVVELTVVSHQGSLVPQTSAQATADEEHHPHVGEDASSVERLDWQLTDDGQAEQASQLSSGGVVGPVKVRLLNWSHDHLVSLRVVEPRLKDLQIGLSLLGPAWLPLLDLVGGDTETNELTILSVVSDLVVDNASLSVIVGIL